MTDKELLELAAKAAGIDAVWFGEDFRFKPRFETLWVTWNPLTDDGDALRLAVKLGIDVTFNDMDVFAFPPNGAEGCSELYRVDDPYAATRRAIVRAAAEIGKEKP